jgi:acyl carrier protein
MNRGDLELRLLRFVPGLRPDAGSEEIRPETALFEEGVVNSLRILDLIAFVEELTGTRIPDAAVRLETFRSIRAIAAAFGEERSADGDAVADARAAPIRVFRRGSGRSGYARPVDDLAACGEVSLVVPGRLVLRGPAGRLPAFFDSVAREWAGAMGAREEAVPERIPREVLARAGCPAGRLAFGESLLPPAVCYHVYRERQGTRLEASPAVVTVVGRCLRDEESLDLARGRLRDFTMRELVVLGSREQVEHFRHGMIDRVAGLVADLDLDGQLATADDPFFLDGAGREEHGRRLMQQVLPLKYELRLTCDERGEAFAVASFNHHRDFFGRRFGIGLASGAIAHSGCVAFGLERWTLAFLARHGIDPKAWPARVRDFVRQEARRDRSA